MTRRTLGAFALLALLQAACGQDAVPPAPDPAEEAVPAAQLPVLGTVGDFPSPRRRFVVSLKADGTLVCKTGEVDFAGFEDLLRAQAAAAPKTSDGSSSLYFVVRVPASVPWDAVSLLLYAAADPKVKAYRVMFAAQPADGGEPGAMGAFLPKDRGCGPAPGTARRTTRVTLALDAEAPDEGVVYADLVDEVRRAGMGPVELAPRSGTRAGWVLRVADLARQAGATGVFFHGMGASGILKEVRERRPAGQRTALQDRMATLATSPAGCRVTLGDFASRSGGGDPAPPRIARVRGRLAGVSAAEQREGDERSVASMDEEALPEPEEEREETEEVHASDLVVKEPTIKDAEIEVEAPEPVTEEPRLRGAPFPGLLRVSRSAVIDRGIDWLVAHQAPGGGWKARGWNEWCHGKALRNPAAVEGDAKNDATVTALALLAVVASGRSHQSKDPYGSVVKQTLLHLMPRQAADGRIDPKAPPIAHAITTLAWVELYALTKSPTLPDATQRALDLLARWARDPRMAGATAAPDGSLAAWTAFALAAAQRVGDAEAKKGNRRPFSVADDVHVAARAWVTIAASPGGPPASDRALSAARLFARFLGGEDPDASDAGTTVEVLLREHVPGRGWTEAADFSHAFFAGLLARQVGPDFARATRAAVVESVIALQRIDGDACGFEGSYDPRDPWGEEGGRVYATAMATLALLADDLYPPRFPAK